MKKLDIDYDEENDSLLAYSLDVKSKGSVEIGNFIFDLDSNGNLVSLEILDVSDFFKVLFSKIIEVSKIIEFKADVVKFRNSTNILNFSITTEDGTERNQIIFPSVEHSPALNY